MSKIIKATFGASDQPLVIADIEIPCYVLDNEKRVLVRSGMIKALGMSKGSSGGTSGDRLAKFVGQDRFTRFISKEILEMTENPITFKIGGNIAYGYEATILVDICEAILRANKAGLILKQQEHIVDRAEILMMAFAKVGIIALVDEATGYQQVRDRNALHKILAAYLNPYLLPWAKKFPDEFYEEMFRLKGWSYDPESVKRPGVVGTYTNKLIYEQLPEGVLEELRNRTPKTSTGSYAAQFHRSLTVDTGHPHLDRQLTAVITLMKISTTWGKFLGHFARAFNTGQQQLNLDED